MHTLESEGVMNGVSSYRIGDPVSDVPPAAVTNPRIERDGWEECYRAAMNAFGRWVPITFRDRVHARRLSEGARKRAALPRLEAEVRGDVCYLRVVGQVRRITNSEKATMADARQK